MAKRSAARSNIVYMPRQSSAAPVIRIQAPKAPRAPRASAPKKKSHRRSSSDGASSLKDRMTKVAIGGAVLGYVDKSGFALPTIPMLGRAGSITLAAYMLGGQKPGIMQDVALAGAAIVGYELGKDGKISGEDD